MKSIAVGVAALMALVIAAFAVQPDQGGAAAGGEAQPEKQEQPKADENIEEKFVYIEMKTSQGDIYLELNNELAPISTKNFVDYANDGFYNGTIFHRVIPGFMIQGGGFDEQMTKKKTNAEIKNEWKNGLKNDRGTIAMARLGGRPDSATSQFFINVVNNAGLDRPQRDGAGYAVFGKVVKGMETVDKIRNTPTTTRAPYENVPIETVVIEQVSVLDASKVEELGLVEVDG
ncbi:MAG: peptidylprolyl isomerase [Phycisphaerales bacterium JB052]